VQAQLDELSNCVVEGGSSKNLDQQGGKTSHPNEKKWKMSLVRGTLPKDCRQAIGKERAGNYTDDLEKERKERGGGGSITQKAKRKWDLEIAWT